MFLTNKAKALFVVIPVNGKWYDFTGFPKEGRNSFLTELKNRLARRGTL
jgi:D-alanine transfer protein